MSIRLKAHMANCMQLSGYVCPTHATVPAGGTLGDHRGGFHLHMHLDSVNGTRMLHFLGPLSKGCQSITEALPS